MNCTGKQTVCLTLNGMWRGGAPKILKGCAMPDVCDLQANTTLGLEASGFHLTTAPECNYVALPNRPCALNADTLRPSPLCLPSVLHAYPNPMFSE
ncbi:hypothetical protein MC885_016313, partial [Smutsia gigantea]